MIPFVNLTAQRNAYQQELEQAERSVLDSGNYIGGSEVSGLEAEISSFCGSKNVITCGSGTDALTIALMALGLKAGDEVIVPDFTFIAPAEAVAQLGGIPKFADIDPKTLQISPESVEKLISPATKGIIAVDLFGQCAPFAELRKIACRHGLWLLEDGAQAFGATYATSSENHDANQNANCTGISARNSAETPARNGAGTSVRNSADSKNACTLADVSITSFYPSKPLGCYGDGGALFTDSDELAKKIRQIANHGSSAHYRHETIGVNSRLDAIQAAVLRVKLKHLPAELEQRRRNARAYDEFFREIAGVNPQKIACGNSSTYAQYTVLADNRKQFIEVLKKAEVPYCIHYPMALHRQPCFAATASAESTNNSNEALSRNNADMVSEKVISLPVCAFTDVETIIKKIRSVL